MKTSPRSVCLRTTSMAIAATAALLGLAALLVPGADLDPGQPFAVLLGQASAVVLLGCAAWAWLVTMVILTEALRARPRTGAPGPRVPARRRGVPAGYRRLVLAACGLTLGAGLTAPALATPGPVHLDPRPAATAPLVHARAPIHLRHVSVSAHQPRRRSDETIVVRDGDSLWHLAAERLPHDSDDATIAHTWRRLYAANTDLIGTDPDHIEPGQRLARPQAW